MDSDIGERVGEGGLTGLVVAKIELNDLQQKRLYKHSLQQLDDGLQVTLNMLKFEYTRAPRVRQEDFSPLLTYFERGPTRTIARCEGVVECLNGRNAILVVACLLYDSQNIKKCQEEVKQKSSELRTR
ncbi:hypothetical protein GYMLUDRAFT_85142 [Collybiopsis luxurians FD-317 M1]|uniref:Uncharacterized protein n=1 Tax=Collybiopsis luxurians FD-317 M1 TaxID=944289 RepID=A0A0D0CQ85_9AGAR|nr:hypothetical protein GYMLUDRAFT_85142 [Collybiopsis luxurians FD-317 M1]